MCFCCFIPFFFNWLVSRSSSLPVGGAELTAAAAAAPQPFSDGVPGSTLAQPANEIVAHVWPQVSHWVPWISDANNREL